MRIKSQVQLLTWVLLLSPALRESSAQPVVNGTLVGDEAFYGAALSVQDTNTGYGNSTNGDPREAFNGSEIDQVFATVRDERLFVLITGNLEQNFNKLDVFIDSESGGSNKLDGGNLPSDVDPFCCGGASSSFGALQALDGFQFDSDFAADHFFAFSNGDHSFGGAPGGQVQNLWTLTAYYADLTDGAAGNKSELGFQYRAFGFEPGLEIGEPIDQLNNGCAGAADTSCNPLEHEFAEPVDTVNDPTNSRGHRDFLNDLDFFMAIDNSNTAGVNFGSGPATGNPQDVATGIEFSVPLSQIGNPTDSIKITAFIANSNHNHVSNQFSGDGVSQGNLGGNVSGINLANISGDQFVTVAVPSADFDVDDDVDGRDFLIWQQGFDFGTLPSQGDADFNGAVTADDLVIWSRQYGQGAAALAAAVTVPEPSTIWLPALAALASLAAGRWPSV